MLKWSNKIEPCKVRVSVFCIAFMASLGLIIGGFFCPPMGKIDGSVLTAVGLLLAFGIVSKIPDVVHDVEEMKLHAGSDGITIETKNDNETKKIEE